MVSTSFALLGSVSGLERGPSFLYFHNSTGFPLMSLSELLSGPVSFFSSAKLCDY